VPSATVNPRVRTPLWQSPKLSCHPADQRSVRALIGENTAAAQPRGTRQWLPC